MVLAQIRIDTFPESRSASVLVPFGQRADLRVRIDAKGAVTLWEGTNDKPSSWRGPAGPTTYSRVRLDNFAKEFDAQTKSWSDQRLDREIRELGEQATRSLPVEMIRALSTRPGLSVQVQHPNRSTSPSSWHSFQ